MFFVDLGPGAAVGGMWIEINTGYSCYLTAARRRRGHFFSLVDLVLGAAVGCIRIEKNTGYSCYLICNNSRHRMVLQLTTKFSSYSLFSDILVFVFVCLCVCISPCICLFYLYHDIFPKFSMASRHSRNISRSRREDALRVEGGRGSISLMYQ